MECTSTILVVDDNAFIREYLEERLVTGGYDVACAATGLEALDYLRRADKPLAIILDLHMPGMDGCEFRERQQQEPDLAAIPVILMSMEVGLEKIAARLGTAGHVQKPFGFEELAGTLRRISKARLQGTR